MPGESKPKVNLTPPEETSFPLTKEFLELAFDREVEKFSTNIGTNPGENYNSIMHAIEVTFKGEESHHYLIKCYPNHPGRRDYLDKTGMFSKEFFMYQDFLPKLKQLAIDSGAEKVVDLSVAQFQGGNIVGKPSKFTVKPWSDENFILMKDLRKTFGFTMADRMKGLDVDHAKLALREMAKFHALSWAYKQKNELALLTNKYPLFKDNVYENKALWKDFKQLMNEIYDNALKLTEEKLGASHPACNSLKKAIPQETRELKLKYVGKDGINEDEMESYLRIKPEHDNDYNKEPWLLGTHGDCWVNNMMFLYNNEVPKKPVKLTLVDWQVFREGCPTIDLAYFFFNSIRASLRILHLDELLRIYHDAFIRNCEALRVPTLPGFTFETLKRRFRRAEIFGLLCSLPVLTFVLKPPDESTDVDTVESDQLVDVYASVVEGSNKNTLLRDEISATVLNLYVKGVI